MALCVIASVLVVAGADPARSDVIVPFAIRFQTIDNGAIRLFGNQVLSCPATASNCAAGRNGTGPAQNDNNFDMVYVDADGSAFPTFNSSRSQVDLPDGSS